ncbi:MAG: hypothetical protein ACO1RT_01690 [Planctomycetaceae bacterium]
MMRLSSILWVTIVLAAPAAAHAQYDFDDFLQAVESGQSKSTPPSLEMPRLAQLPDGPDQPMLGDTGPQPVPLNGLAPIESLPAPPQSQPQQMYFEELFDQQDVGLSQPHPVVSHGCQSCGHASHRHECAVMPYRTPNLPAPATIHGYFRASPCVANVWDGYSCEAAAECAKTQRKLMGHHGHCHGHAHGFGKTPCE